MGAAPWTLWVGGSVPKGHHKAELYGPGLVALPRQRALGAKRYTLALDDALTIAYGLR